MKLICSTIFMALSAAIVINLRPQIKNDNKDYNFSDIEKKVSLMKTNDTTETLIEIQNRQKKFSDRSFDDLTSDEKIMLVNLNRHKIVILKARLDEKLRKIKI